MDEDKDLAFISDAVTCRPHGFSIGGKHFYIYPLTLGKIYIMKNIIERLDFQSDKMLESETIEALRVAKEQRQECLKLISCYTFDKKEDLFDIEKLRERVEFFEDNISDEDLAAMVLTILSADKTSQIMVSAGIEKEHERMSKAMAVKDNKNSLIFGGKTVFGTLLDAACERYGWTKDYVVWGIDYTSLRLMLSDKITDVYMTDDERKRLPSLFFDKDSIDASDPNSTKELIAFFSSKGIKVQDENNERSGLD